MLMMMRMLAPYQTSEDLAARQDLEAGERVDGRAVEGLAELRVERLGKHEADVQQREHGGRHAAVKGRLLAQQTACGRIAP